MLHCNEYLYLPFIQTMLPTSNESSFLLLPCRRGAGVLSEQPLTEFNKVVSETAAAHFVFVKHIAPVLTQSATSSILFVSNGAGGHG